MAQKSKKYIVGICLLFAGAALFQNCAKPLNLPDATPASTASSSTLTTTQTNQVLSSLPLSGSASEGTVYPNDTVVLTATGGSAPYTFTQISGSGTLANNVYLAGSPSSSVAIEIRDAANATFVLALTVQPRTCSATQPSATQTQPCSSNSTGTAKQSRTVTCNTSTGNWDVSVWSALDTSACVLNTCTLDGSPVAIGTVTQNCSSTQVRISQSNYQTQYTTYNLTCQANGLWSNQQKSASAGAGCPSPGDGGGS